MPILLVDRRRIPLLATHADHLTITPAEGNSIGIEHIKSVQEWAYLRPFVKQHKKLLLQTFHKATHEAQNALLKLIEEPPNNTHIYVHTNDVDNILATIVSRCRIDNSLTDEDIMWQAHEHTGAVESTLLNITNLTNPQKQPVSTIFAEADTLSKHDRKDLIEYLDSVLFALAKEPAEHKTPATAATVRHLLEAKKMLSANTNIKLTMEHLLLQLYFVLK